MMNIHTFGLASSILPEYYAQGKLIAQYLWLGELLRLMAHADAKKEKGILSETWHPVLPMLGVMIVMLSLIFYNQLPTGAQKNLLKVLSLLENKFTLFKA